jgi:uncharacterized protein YifN (PemK superfamily)
MPLTFQPKPRTVVYCDFAGYIEPEIVKRRPVVVLAVHKRNSKLVAVVPLSTTKPDPVEAHHHRLLQNPLSDKHAGEVWAKCDMVAVVSIERLELVRTGRRLPDGRREYLLPKIGLDQFEAIRKGVASALGLGSLFGAPGGTAETVKDPEEALVGPAALDSSKVK